MMARGLLRGVKTPRYGKHRGMENTARWAPPGDEGLIARGLNPAAQD